MEVDEALAAPAVVEPPTAFAWHALTEYSSSIMQHSRVTNEDFHNAWACALTASAQDCVVGGSDGGGGAGGSLIAQYIYIVCRDPLHTQHIHTSIETWKGDPWFPWSHNRWRCSRWRCDVLHRLHVTRRKPRATQFHEPTAGDAVHLCLKETQIALSSNNCRRLARFRRAQFQYSEIARRNLLESYDKKKSLITHVRFVP